MQILSFKPKDGVAVKKLISSIMEKEYPSDEKVYQYGDLDNISGAYGKLREKFLVVEEGGNIIGTVGIKEDSDSVALLRRLFVHPSHRGRGLGSMLVDTAIDFCRMNGYKTIIFKATSRMKTAINLLTVKKGFMEKERHIFDGIEIIVLEYYLH